MSNNNTKIDEIIENLSKREKELRCYSARLHGLAYGTTSPVLDETDRKAMIEGYVALERLANNKSYYIILCQKEKNNGTHGP